MECRLLGAMVEEQRVVRGIYNDLDLDSSLRSGKKESGLLCILDIF